MTVEERLRGALHARADQITPDRLHPAEPPRPHRSPARTIAAMAAAVLAIAVLSAGIVFGRHLWEGPAAPIAPATTTPAPAKSAPPNPTPAKPGPGKAGPKPPAPGLSAGGVPGAPPGERSLQSAPESITP
jgi:hypothetical protein